MRFPATLLTIFCCIYWSVAKAQSPYIAGGRAIALGDAALLMHDVWAVHNDPAALGELRHWQAGIWTERQYNLSVLSSGALAVALPLGKKSQGTLGFGLYVFGGTA